MTAGVQRRNEHFRLAAQADDVLLDAGEEFGRDQLSTQCSWTMTPRMFFPAIRSS
jgi:hypothetical protein